MFDRILDQISQRTKSLEIWKFGKNLENPWVNISFSLFNFCITL